MQIVVKKHNNRKGPRLLLISLAVLYHVPVSIDIIMNIQYEYKAIKLDAFKFTNKSIELYDANQILYKIMF